MKLRPPDVVMGVERAAAAVPTPLAFPRAAMRQLVAGRWQVRKLRIELDEEGRGEVLYQLQGAGWTFHFFLLSYKLAEEQKTDRNFAAGWDAMGVLCQGAWTPEREAHLRQEIPKQRAGVTDYDTLMTARGNRSARVFDHVVDRLAAGLQPDLSLIAPIGYILRTTAFIGNGALGTRPLAGFEPDHPLRRPYHAQFVSGFMLREYVFDLVDHIARMRSPKAVRMAPAWRRFLGLGNSAATGLSAFVANRPHLMHQWVQAHEQAGAEARTRVPSADDRRRFGELLARAILHFEQAAREPDGVFQPPLLLARELRQLQAAFDAHALHAPWQALADWAAGHLGAQAVEVLHALLLELYPDLVARHDDALLAPERFEVDPAMSVGELRALVERDYGWVLQRPAEPHYFWYRCTSAPRDTRRGPRSPAPDLVRENTFDTQLQVRRLHEHLRTLPADAPVAAVTTARADLRHIVARVQSLAGCDYAELRYDWLAPDFSPFPTIRLPLTFFGMEKFEAAPPKSVRGVFLQGAPIAEDVAAGRDGTWPYPLIPQEGHEDDGTVLAPLPPSTGAPPPRAQVPFPSVLKIAPGELARLAAVALQGHGAALGVAEDAGVLVAHAHGCGHAAVAAVLAHCERRSVGRCAAVAAPAAFDQAIAAAHGSQGLGAVRVDADDAWLAQGLALQAARRGLVALLVWQSGGEQGCVVAAPGSEGVRVARLALPHAPALADALQQQDLAALGPGPHWAERWCARLARPAAAPLADGFLLLVLRASEPGALPALSQALAANGHDAGWTDPAAQEAAWQRHGLDLATAQFWALHEAGKALLVPQADEPRFLPPGMNPLTTF